MAVRHYGGRMVFTPRWSASLSVGLGDRGHQMIESQDLDSHTGTLIRIHPDGSVPADNPYVNTEGALPEIWSYGHRNIQGIDISAKYRACLGRLSTVPQGGDEVKPT